VALPGVPARGPPADCPDTAKCGSQPRSDTMKHSLWAQSH